MTQIMALPVTLMESVLKTNGAVMLPPAKAFQMCS